jgi:hypothetical protein
MSVNRAMIVGLTGCALPFVTAVAAPAARLMPAEMQKAGRGVSEWKLDDKGLPIRFTHTSTSARCRALFWRLDAPNM